VTQFPLFCLPSQLTREPFAAAVGACIGAGASALVPRLCAPRVSCRCGGTEAGSSVEPDGGDGSSCEREGDATSVGSDGCEVVPDPFSAATLTASCAAGSSVGGRRAEKLRRIR